MLYAVPAACILAGVILGVALARRGRWGWFWGIVTGMTALGGWLWVKAQYQSSGWDALAYFIPVMLGLAPLALGMLLGGGAVRLRLGKRSAE